MRRFLLEEQTDGLMLPHTTATSGGALVMSTSRSSVDGWQHQSQSPPTRSRRRVSGGSAGDATSLTARCRSLPGRMESAHSSTQPLSGRSGVVSGSAVDDNDGWSTTEHRAGRQSRSRRHLALSPGSHHQHHQQHRRHQSHTSSTMASGYYSNNRVASPSFVTSSSHLTLPLNRSPARSVTSQQHFLTSQRAAPANRQRQQQQQQTSSMTSPSHFSWPGVSFEAGTVSEGVPDEGHSSGVGTPAAEQASPSLPSSTSTATNPCVGLPGGQLGRSGNTRGAVCSSGAASNNGGSGGHEARTDDEDIELTDAEPNSESTMGGAAGHVTSEFDVLDEDYWLSSKRRWSRSEADWSGTEWAPVTSSIDIIGDPDDGEGFETPPPMSQPEEEASSQQGDPPLDDVQDEEIEETARVENQTPQNAVVGNSGGLPFNETVLKCIASCDKVLMRHSTTIS
jgi:hypothetical protein